MICSLNNNTKITPRIAITKITPRIAIDGTRWLQGKMSTLRKPKPQNFGAFHGPLKPQYFFVVIFGRRNNYVEVDIFKKVHKLAP